MKMKTLKLFLGAFGLLSLASCSNDELTNVNRDGDEIAFNVITNSHTRADKIYDNTTGNQPSPFYVSAKHSEKKYIDKDKIQLTNNEWENISGTRYWPNDGAVTFFAYLTENDNIFKWNNVSDAPKFENFEVTSVENPAEHEDLIYAVEEETKPDNGKVTLNFRHALSQIVFKAKNTNPNLYVEISGVSVCNVKNKGTFTFPTTSTDNTSNGVGTWIISDDATLNDYAVTFDEVKLGKYEFTKEDNSKETIDNTTSDPTLLTDKAHAMLLIPQKDATPWNVTTKPDEDDNKGTYFKVKCKIFNVAGDKYDATNDVCLWGNDGAKEVAIPVTISWEPGNKYIYTFEFGNGNGGYDPTGPTDVLLPITFNVSVVDFTDVNVTPNIVMDKPGTTTTTD